MKVSPLQSIFWLLNNWKDIDEKWWTFDLFFCNSIWFLINMRSNFTDNPQSLVSFLFFSFFLNFFLSFSVCFFFVVLWSRFFFFSRIFAVKKEAADGRRRLGPRSTSAYRGCWWNATGPGTLCWPRRMSGTWNTPTGPAPSAQHRNGINDSLSLSLSLSSFFIFPFQRSFARHFSKKQNKRRTPDYEDDREGHTRRHWPLPGAQSAAAATRSL